VRGRRSVGVVLAFRGHDLLQLTAVEENAPAALALLDVDTTPVDGPHQVLALGTDHPTSLRRDDTVDTSVPVTTPGVTGET
jgi:hypothetical protein